MKDVPLTLYNKAFLLSIGSIDISKHNEFNERPSFAGPSTGINGSIFISSNNKRIRLFVNQKSPIKGKININKRIILYYKNEIILTGKIDTILAHCPDQAYITLSEKCIFECKFCATPKIGTKIKKIDEIFEILKEANNKKTLKAISITSGVFRSPDLDLKYILYTINIIKKKYNVPIGVSIIPSQNCNLLLRNEGVLEVKYNLETFDKKIFTYVCPNLNYDLIIDELIKAVKIFGKGHVFSNIIVGLGENDLTIINGIRLMAKNGIIVNLRPISITTYIENNGLNWSRPSKERLLTLYKYHKKILEEYGLSNIKSLSMCSLCCGCDLVPQKDD